jgi:hypothetical protein
LRRQLGRLRGLPRRIHCHRGVALATQARKSTDSGGFWMGVAQAKPR